MIKSRVINILASYFDYQTNKLNLINLCQELIKADPSLIDFSSSYTALTSIKKILEEITVPKLDFYLDDKESTNYSTHASIVGSLGKSIDSRYVSVSQSKGDFEYDCIIMKGNKKTILERRYATYRNRNKKSLLFEFDKSNKLLNIYTDTRENLYAIANSEKALNYKFYLLPYDEYIHQTEESDSVYYVSTLAIRSSILTKNANVFLAEDVLYRLMENIDNIIEEDFSESIVKLIYAQQHYFNPIIPKDKTQKKIVFKTSELEELVNGLYFSKNFRSKPKLIDIITYIYDLYTNKPLSTRILNKVNLGDFLSTYKYKQAYDLKLDGKLSTPSLEEENLIKKYIPPRIKTQISHIYKIASKTPKNYKNHKTLMHGTGSISILNILGEGLLTNNDLKKHNIKHYYTGSGLGQGVYFTDLNHIMKCLNYSDQYSEHQREYVFVCDVFYNTNENVDRYNSAIKQKTDLITGVKIDGHGWNEYVATKSDMIQLKYIIEIN